MRIQPVSARILAEKLRTAEFRSAEVHTDAIAGRHVPMGDRGLGRTEKSGNYKQKKPARKQRTEQNTVQRHSGRLTAERGRHNMVVLRLESHHKLRPGWAYIKDSSTLHGSCLASYIGSAWSIKESAGEAGVAGASITKYDFVDTLRGLAVLGVVAIHTSELAPPSSLILQTIAHAGSFGVQLFYVASALTLFLSMR